MKYAYLLFCVFNNRPAGRVGLYRSRAAAEQAARHERQTTRIRRERVSKELWERLPK